LFGCIFNDLQSLKMLAHPCAKETKETLNHSSMNDQGLSNLLASLLPACGKSSTSGTMKVTGTSIDGSGMFILCMRLKMKATKKSNAGITLMELLIGLAFLLILTAFIAPNLQSDTGRSEMQKAVGDFNQHLEMARFAARRLNTEITVDFQQELRARNHSISFLLPGEPNLEPVRKELVLPEKIRLKSPQSSVRFDPLGKAELAAQVELKSERNRLLNERFLVE
jgi:type II secretory pathway pseudopilin PulG